MGFTGGVDAHHVGVVDAGGKRGLLFKLRGQERIVAPVALENLQRQVPLQRHIKGLVHGPHPPGSKQAFEPELPKALQYRDRVPAPRTLHDRKRKHLGNI